MNVMFTSCDKEYFDYAIRMLKSFKQYNETKMYFGNIDCTKEQLDSLEALGATVVPLKSIETLETNRLTLNFVDWLIYPTMEHIRYDKILWIDADTLILDNIEELFEPIANFVGHPGRNKKGAILSEHGKARFAGGTWVGTRPFTNLLYQHLEELHNLNVESQALTNFIVDKGITYHILDPSIYNFSRELIDKAEKDKEGKVFYRVYPKTAGFSIKNDGLRGKIE